MRSGMRPSIERKLQNDNLVLLEDHENDDDDLVPELSYPVVEIVPKAVVKPAKHDFAGAEYTEVYDDWKYYE